MSNFFNLQGRTFYLSGLAGRKSIAFVTAQLLKKQGANLILSVQNEEIKEKIKKSFPDEPIFIFDVTQKEHEENLKSIMQDFGPIDGALHSLAYARFDEKTKNFLDVPIEHFIEAVKISYFSFKEMVRLLRPYLGADASLVTISISETSIPAYGYLGPIKQMLETSISHLAKELSKISLNMRVNAVKAGPLKTQASAGIPGYVDNYLFAEKLTLRKKALQTQEVANAIAFLLSPLSSGMNAQTLKLDAGISSNFFDEEVVEKTLISS